MSNLVNAYVKNRTIHVSEFKVGMKFRILNPEYIVKLGSIVTLIRIEKCGPEASICKGCKRNNWSLRFSTDEAKDLWLCNTELETIDGRKIIYE
jgi:hypothetical protein